MTKKTETILIIAMALVLIIMFYWAYNRVNKMAENIKAEPVPSETITPDMSIPSQPPVPFNAKG